MRKAIITTGKQVQLIILLYTCIPNEQRIGGQLGTKQLLAQGNPRFPTTLKQQLLL